MKPATALAAGLLAAACLPAAAVPLLQGTTVTGTVSGASSVLLGIADGYAELVGPVSAPVSGVLGDIEFLTGDYALGIDFDEHGLVSVIDNSGGALLAGTYAFSFSFAGLADDIGRFTLGDLSALAGGSVQLSVWDGQTVTLTLTDLQFAQPYAAITAQLAVPEPGSALLAFAGLAMLGTLRRAARPGR
jgi:hypothetical protein